MLLVCGFVIAGVVAGNLNSANAVASSEIASPTPPRRTQRRVVRRTPARYVDFPHSANAHQIACDRCHKFPSPNWNKVRTGDAAYPDITDYPQHESCVGCHKAQFFRGNPPQICSICHTNPGPRDSSRHPFPNPKEIFDQSPKGKIAITDFAVQFPHDKHVDIVTAAAAEPQDIFTKAAYVSPKRVAAEESCSVCHKTLYPQGEGADEYAVKPPDKLGDAFWLKKGTFKTIPTGHTTCFTCHNADSGIAPAPSDCATCHKLKQKFTPDFDPKLAATMSGSDKTTIDLWRNRVSAGAFRHEWMSHAELSCDTCHNVTKMNTAIPASRKVELSSCATCHVTATADDGGALNYEVDQRAKNPKFQCAKCHITYGKMPIPVSHLDAIKAAGGK